MPLSDARQNDLIDRAFLPSKKRETVRKHVATATGGTFRNPMLLSLLCRYVKDKGVAPTNDFDLVRAHVVHLTGRDPKYLQAKYRLSPAQLLEGAEILARVLAETAGLGLAPSFDELKGASSSFLTTDEATVLLDALVDLKVGRVDVPHAKPGDRRFAFAHRRYQEVLYVSYLRIHAHTRRPRELLTDPRWREYAVTFLQSQSASVIAPLVSDAIALLTKVAERQKGEPCDEPIGADLCYFDWDAEGLDHVLNLLKEGFSNKPSDVPVELRAAIRKVLEQRWLSGDTFDLVRVATFSVLMDQETATACMRTALNLRIQKVDEVVTRAIAYAGQVPKELQRSFLRGVSDATLAASNAVELMRLDAMTSRLSPTSGAAIVFRRSKRLRSLLLVPHRVLVPILSPIGTIFQTRRIRFDRASLATMIGPAMVMGPIAMLISSVVVSESTLGMPLKAGDKVAIAVFAVVGLFLTVATLLRTYPESVRFSTCHRLIAKLPGLMLDGVDWKSLSMALAALAVTLVGPGALVHLVALVLGLGPVTARWYVTSTVIFLGGSVLILLGAMVKFRVTAIRRFKQFRSESSRPTRVQPLEVTLSARSFSELYLWLTRYPQSLLVKSTEQRSVLRILREVDATKLPSSLSKYPIEAAWHDGADPSGRRALQEVLLERTEEASPLKEA